MLESLETLVSYCSWNSLDTSSCGSFSLAVDGWGGWQQVPVLQVTVTLCSSGWRDSAQPWMHPGKSDFSQEAADPRGWEPSGKSPPCSSSNHTDSSWLWILWPLLWNFNSQLAQKLIFLLNTPVLLVGQRTWAFYYKKFFKGSEKYYCYLCTNSKGQVLFYSLELSCFEKVVLSWLNTAFASDHCETKSLLLHKKRYF